MTDLKMLDGQESEFTMLDGTMLDGTMLDDTMLDGTMLDGQTSALNGHEPFWPDDGELATNGIYNNQDPVNDIPIAFSRDSEDFFAREQPAEKEDHGREAEWLDFLSKSSESNTSTLAWTQPVAQEDEVYSCVTQFIDDHTKTELEMVDLENRKIEAKKQKMRNDLEVLKLRYERKVAEKTKEQAKLQAQRENSTT